MFPEAVAHFPVWRPLFRFSIANYALMLGVSSVQPFLGFAFDRNIYLVTAMIAAVYAGVAFARRAGRTPVDNEMSKLVWGSTIVSLVTDIVDMIVASLFTSSGLGGLMLTFDRVVQQVSWFGVIGVILGSLLIQALTLWIAYGPALRFVMRRKIGS
ncbi:MAG: ABZJ_00895 family protein [Pseudomonadota bacterium]